MGWIKALILVCVSIGVVAAQKPSVPTLQLGTPIERTLSTGQSHTFQVVAEENSLVQIIIEQRGIDVVVRVHHPLGKKPAEYDSPTGTDGAEDVTFVTASKTPYLIEVTPLNREPVPAGKYKIELTELRPATEQEIKESKSQEVLRARGLALLSEIEGTIAEVRLPQTRIKAQMQAALMLWESDEKRALKYFTEAATGLKELIATADPASREYTKNYQIVTGLRFEIVQSLTPRRPEMALSFLRSLPGLPDPYGNQRDLAANEAAMEMEIANQIAAKDPKRTLEIARENLKTRYSSALINTITILRQKNAELAAELAADVATKLLGENLTNNSQAASLVIGLIQMSGPAGGTQGGETNGSSPRVALLSDQQRRELIQKALKEALAFKTPAAIHYSSDRYYAQGLLQGLQSLGAEIDSLEIGSLAAVNKKFSELSAINNSMMPGVQEYYDAINNMNMPVDEVIQVLLKAPQQLKEQLFIQLSGRVQNNGDMARARQIVNDHVTTPYQRQQALYNLDMQEMYRAMSKGKVEDALRSVASLPTIQERAQALSQLVTQIGPGQKRAAAIVFLNQARALLPPSLQAQDHAQMHALLELAKAYSRLDTKLAFEIVDPLIDQFNEISVAARGVDGFLGEFYEQEELNLQNGNMIASIATQLSSTLATIALTNFDRAKLAVERIRLPEVRLRAYLDIATQAIQAK